jgi:hypothetical protein
MNVDFVLTRLMFIIKIGREGRGFDAKKTASFQKQL